MSRFRALAGLTIFLWAVELVNLLTGHRLNAFGIEPRTASGLAGIPLAPLLHGSVAHVASNSGGMALLGGLVSLRGEAHYIRATVGIALLGGLLVWLFGRPAMHIGASGLIFGYFGLLLGQAWYQRTLSAIAVATLVIGLYGSLLLGLSPLQRHVSWEGHAAGLVAGLAMSRWQRLRPG